MFHARHDIGDENELAVAGLEILAKIREAESSLGADLGLLVLEETREERDELAA
jgi:hypothetical protein